MIVVTARTGDGLSFEFCVQVAGARGEDWLTRRWAVIRLQELGVKHPEGLLDVAARDGEVRIAERD